MIKVLHLITSFGLGGAEVNLWRLVCNMDRSRFSNTVVTMVPMRAETGIVQPTPEEAGIPLHALEMRNGIPDPLSAARLFRIIRQVKPDVLQTWMYHADLLGLLVGKSARVPAIAWNLRCSFIDMNEHSWISKYVLRLLVSLSSSPDVVLANSHSGLRFHEELGYKPRKWMWIPNALDLEQFKPDARARACLRRELGLPPDALIVGLVARFYPMKDHQNFVKAAGWLARDNPNAHFVLVGRRVDAENAQLAEWIKATGFADRFHLLGLRQDANRVTAGFDIGCSSSYGEGFSNTVAESMASGVPCVVTDVGDSAELVGDTGKIVSAKDPEAFAKACQELVTLAPSQRQHLGCMARKRIEDNYSLKSVVDRYESLYQQLAEPAASH
jgi:glycosyltransferase involved in cell wall biosynthesis